MCVVVVEGGMAVRRTWMFVVSVAQVKWVYISLRWPLASRHLERG